MAVIRVSDFLDYINTFIAFRAVPSVDAYGHITDAGCEIIRSYELGPMEKWVVLR